MTARLRGIAVVGASVAGVAAADAVRAAGYPGPVWLFDAQPHPPYDRPPLSKKALVDLSAAAPSDGRGNVADPEGSGDVVAARFSLRDPGHWAEWGITLMLGTAVTVLRAASRVVIAGGREFACDAVVLAPGARPHDLPFGTGDAAVHVLRTAADAQRLGRALRAARSLVVVGAGFVGLEVASAARQRGIAVTVVESVTDPLVAAIGAPAAAGLLDRHRAAGTVLLTGQRVLAVRRSGSGAVVTLDSGRELPADAVVAGIGVRPATDWLAGSGIALGDGIVTDDRLATGLAGIYACGDAASWHNPVYGRRMRIEHWTTAREQGVRAGTNAARFALTGEPGESFGHVPYVWSDQLGCKVQFVGYRPPGSQTTVDRLDERGLVASHHLAGRLVARTTINAPREVMLARRQIHAEWLDLGPSGDQPTTAPAPGRPGPGAPTTLERVS